MTPWSSYFAANPTHTAEASDGAAYFAEYYSALYSGSPTLRFDFGAVIRLSGIALWNEETYGAGKFNLKDGSGNVL